MIKEGSLKKGDVITRNDKDYTITDVLDNGSVVIQDAIIYTYPELNEWGYKKKYTGGPLPHGPVTLPPGWRLLS